VKRETGNLGLAKGNMGNLGTVNTRAPPPDTSFEATNKEKRQKENPLVKVARAGGNNR